MRTSPKEKAYVRTKQLAPEFFDSRLELGVKDGRPLNPATDGKGKFPRQGTEATVGAPRTTQITNNQDPKFPT